MREKLKSWLRVWSLGFTAIVMANCQTSPDESQRPLQIILLAGQSNMEGAGNFDAISPETLTKLEAIGDRIKMRRGGNKATIVRYTLSNHKLEKYGFEKSFGPEVGLAVSLAERYPAQEFLFVKTTRGGTSLYGAWSPDWTAEKAAAVEKAGEKRRTSYYAQHIEQVRATLFELDSKNIPYEIAGGLWLQGENDAAKEIAARSYEANLETLISRFRSDLDTPDMPFVIGQINSRYGRFKEGPNMVRASMVRVAERDPRAAIVLSTTDTDWPDFPKHSDNVHYNAEGQMRWGRAFAAELEGLGAFK